MVVGAAVLGASGAAYKNAVREAAAVAGRWAADEAPTLQELHAKVVRLQGG